MTSNPRYRSKTVAAWLALLLGALGAHRFYLGGLRDTRAWLYPVPTLLGLLGVLRMRTLGQDDAQGAMLVPLIGVTVSLAMLAGIVIALTPDEKWDARHNPGTSGHASGWGAVTAAMVGLFAGAVVLLSTVAFGGQRFFEWQAEHPAATAAQTDWIRTASR
jgi:4-hydroxybenzoate polyprenyltransferase